MRAAIAALCIGVILAVLLLFDQTDDRGKGALATATASLSVGMLGGIAGIGALGSWFLALNSGFGGFALLFFYITPHLIFKFGLRFIHPPVFRTKDNHSDRELLAFLYSLPCALFTLSLPLGPALQSIVTGRFLSDPDVPSTGMPSLTQFFFIEAFFALLFAVGFYGYGMAMILEKAENVKSSNIDTVIVGGGNGILILSTAIFMHWAAGFNPAPHFITKQEFVSCFLFNGLLAGTVFNSYRLRRSHGINKTPNPSTP